MISDINTTCFLLSPAHLLHAGVGKGSRNGIGKGSQDLGVSKAGKGFGHSAVNKAFANIQDQDVSQF